MAVPNTSYFNLQDVVNEINPPANTLESCFSQAKSRGFVSSYSGAKDRLSNFRGYNHNSRYY